MISEESLRCSLMFSDVLKELHLNGIRLKDILDSEILVYYK